MAGAWLSVANFVYFVSIGRLEIVERPAFVELPIWVRNGKIMLDFINRTHAVNNLPTSVDMLF